MERARSYLIIRLSTDNRVSLRVIVFDVRPRRLYQRRISLQSTLSVQDLDPTRR